MMILLIMLITTIYLIFTGVILYLFYKNDYDLKKTIRYIKVKILSCCIKNKEKLIEQVGEEEVEKIEDELIKIDDCQEPLNFPLDLCYSSELEVEEVKIRENILKIINEKDNFVVDGGKEKLILPLEATLFLTKSMSPLVTEDGEIQVISKHKQIEKSEYEEIKIYIKSLKDEEGESLYEDDEAIIKMIKDSINADLKNKIKKDDVDIDKEINKIKEKEEITKDKYDPKLLKTEDDLIFDDDNTEEKEITLDNLGDSLDQEILFNSDDEDKNNNDFIKEDNPFGDTEENNDFIKEDNPFGDTEENNDFIKEDNPFGDTEENNDFIKEDNPFGDTEENNDFIKEDNPFGEENELDFSEIEKSIIDEVDNLDFGEEEQEDRDSFFKKRKYKSLKLKKIDKTNLKEELEKLLDNDNLKKAILTNLIKTKPLIFNDNKEVVFVDQKNLIFALAKSYGMEGNNVLKEFEKYTMKETILLSKMIAEGMEEYISDIVTGNKRVNRMIFKKNNDLFFSFGVFIITTSFLNVLNEDDYALFRALPYNTEYSITDTTEKTKTALVPALSDVEI